MNFSDSILTQLILDVNVSVKLKMINFQNGTFAFCLGQISLRFLYGKLKHMAGSSMQPYQFFQFELNSQTLTLYKQGSRQSIRPKTALLLLELIKNRHRVMTKNELFLNVWQTAHVQDHTLFQLISEIRKLAPEHELIRTQPNQGYQWVAEANQKRQRNLPTRTAMVASLTGVCASLLLFSSWSALQSTQTAQISHRFPATQAYIKAVQAMENGNPDTAEKHLRFSLSENPDSIDAQLLLAESLLQQGKVTDSEMLALTMLNQDHTSSYAKSTASQLLSQIYQQKGLTNQALRYARRSFDQLQGSQSICTAQQFEKQIGLLASRLGDEQASLLAENQQTTSSDETLLFATQYSTNKIIIEQTEQCSELQNTSFSEDISACFLNNQSSLYAAKENQLDDLMLS